MSSTDLEKTLQSLEKTLKERDEVKIYQFPLWPEPKRGVPNDFARSALFTARKKVSSELIRDKEVFCQGGISITYTGAALTQDHLDVYEGIMHLARQHPENSEIGFSSRGLLKLINRQTGGKDHKRLSTTLKDLTATAIEVKREGRKIYWGSLLPEGSAEEGSDTFRVTINRNLIKLFEAGFTLIEHDQRKKLARSPLARHLQFWLASHKKPYPVTVQFLYELTGSEAKELKDFRRSLKNALHKLVEIGFLDDWRIDKKSDKIYFEKAFTPPN